MAVQSIPPAVASAIPSQEAPWHFSPEMTKKLSLKPGESFAKLEITPDTLEYQFVKACFEHSDPVNRMISQVWCIYNPSATKTFESTLPKMEREALNPAFESTWQEEEGAHLRQAAFKRWQKISQLFPVKHPEEARSLKGVTILPLWHGTSEARGHSVCDTGFTFNDGQVPFGNGIYFTNSAEYASFYTSSNDLLLSWVSMRDPYPVISDKVVLPPDVKALQGSSIRCNYNAHYIPVLPANPGADKGSYCPCSRGQTPKYDEFVVFQPAQTLVRFWVKIDIALMANPSMGIRGAAIHDLSLEIIRRAEQELISADAFEETYAALREALKIVQRLHIKLPELVFGKRKWKEIFDLVVEEPALPHDIDEILKGDCPFFPGKRVMDTHFLTLVPEGMTLEKLEALTLNPRGNKIGFTGRNKDTWAQYGKVLSKAHWVLMPTDVLPGSRDKTWADQQEMAKKYTSQGYQLLSIIDAAHCLLIEYVQTGKRFYPASPDTWTRCLEVVVVGSDKWPVVIGGFASGGPVVYYNDGGAHEDDGLGLARKFF